MDPRVVTVFRGKHIHLHKGAAHWFGKGERGHGFADAGHISDDRDIDHIVPHAGVIANSDAEICYPSTLRRDEYDPAQVQRRARYYQQCVGKDSIGVVVPFRSLVVVDCIKWIEGVVRRYRFISVITRGDGVCSRGPKARSIGHRAGPKYTAIAAYLLQGFSSLCYRSRIADTPGPARSSTHSCQQRRLWKE